MRNLDRYWPIWTNKRFLVEIPALPLSYAPLFVIPLLLLVACGGSATAIVQPPPTASAIPMIEGAQTQTPRTAVRPSRTADRPSGGIPFPQFAPVASPRIILTARLEGTLEFVDGCLRVRRPDGMSYLVIWPPEVTLRNDNGDIQIIAAGKIVARLGDTVILAGSGGPSLGRIGPGTDHPLREDLPAGCPGPYWGAGAIGS